MKYSRTFLVESIVDKVATDDSSRALLKRWFGGVGGKPKGFFKMVASVAEEIDRHIEEGVVVDGAVRRGGDAVHIVSLDTGRLSCAHKALATLRIAEGNHRLAMKADFERLRAEKQA